MKKLILFSFLISALYSCISGECVECTRQLPNSTLTQEVCQEGSDLSVKTILIGIGKDTVITNTSLITYKSTLEAQGYICK